MQYVREVMSRDVKMVHENIPLARAARMMKDNDIGFLVVGDTTGATGCITDRDIVVNAVARGLNPNQHTVGEAMTGNLITCEVGDKVVEVVRRMQEYRVKRMVVTDGDHNLVGIVSLSDLVSRSEIGDSEMAETVERIYKSA